MPNETGGVGEAAKDVKDIVEDQREDIIRCLGNEAEGTAVADDGSNNLEFNGDGILSQREITSAMIKLATLSQIDAVVDSTLSKDAAAKLNTVREVK